MTGTPQDDWLIAVLGVDPALMTGGGVAGGRGENGRRLQGQGGGGGGTLTAVADVVEPGGGSPAQGGGRGTGSQPAAPGPKSNPFDAPEARVHIEKLALPTVQRLAVEQSQNAARDFQTAIEKVRKQKKAKTDADAARTELMYSIILTIALMPLGPVVEAAANAVAAPKLRSALAETLASNSEALEKKFGAKAVGGAFDFVTSDAVTHLADSFDAAKAKKMLDKGVDTLKDKTVKFVASSDEAECTDNYLDALQKSANDAMHNLTDLIGTTTSYSEAVAFYNLFSGHLQESYEAVVSQQVDDMLSELKDVLATKGERRLTAANKFNVTTTTEEIVEVNWKGKPLLAHCQRVEVSGDMRLSSKLKFSKWVTPDMERQAAKMVKEKVAENAFEGQQVPEPNREPGERVIVVDYHGAEKLMLIKIEDTGWWPWWREYGTREFVRWADDADDEKALRSRGALQIGGIDNVAIGSIQGAPK